MLRIINKLKSRKGFTLIELIVVLAVLGVIAAIAVPKFLNVQEDAKEDADYATVAMIATAAELYNAKNNSETHITITDLETEGYIENGIEFQSKKFNDEITSMSAIDINVDSYGNVTVNTKAINGKELYPDKEL